MHTDICAFVNGVLSPAPLLRILYRSPAAASMSCDPIRCNKYPLQFALRSPFLHALARCNPTACSSLCGRNKKYLLFLNGLKKLYHTRRRLSTRFFVKNHCTVRKNCRLPHCCFCLVNLPVDRLQTVLLQKCVGLAERSAAEKSACSGKRTRMGRL